MEKTPLKLKLKLGGSSGPATPEQQQKGSPAPHPTIISMGEEEPSVPVPTTLASDEDGEEEEAAEELQGEDDHQAEEEGSKSRSRHSHHDDGAREKHKKSKKKKKKKEREKDKERHKHRHHRDKTEAGVEEVAAEDQPPPSKKPHLEGGIGGAGSLSKASITEAPMVTPKTKETTAALVQLLEHLLGLLEKKDPQQFFAWPVTDTIAPGYSSIISQPMDFSSMKTKIQEGAYTSLSDFQIDFELMCNNCMTYNQQDTIYYKAAKKLLHAGQKMMVPEKILHLKRDVPLMPLLSKEQLGFEVSPPSTAAGITEGDDTLDTEPMESMDEDGDSKDPLSKFEVVQDNLTSEEMLEQVQGAASEAAEKLTLKRPSSTLGFLRQRGDGTTSLSFLTGCEGDSTNLKEKPVSLGLLTGKLTQGSATLHNYRDDKRSMAKPIKPVYYGSYSSFCPSYDSTFANLSKEESEMVYATYGNETAVQYAKSIVDFSQDCDMAMHLVDQLLNLLTHQQHSRTKTAIHHRRRMQEEEERITALLCPPSELGSQAGAQESKPNPAIDFGSLHSLSDLGIDTTFLTHFEEQEKRDSQINNQLEENASLLEQLSREQHDRLSRPLPSTLNSLAPPSHQELRLVEKVTEGLTQVAKQASPGALAPVPIVRRAMGITVLPVTSEPSDNIEVDIETSWGQEKTTAPPPPPTPPQPTTTTPPSPPPTTTTPPAQKPATGPRDLESQLSQILHQSEAAPPPSATAMTDTSLREVLDS